MLQFLSNYLCILRNMSFTPCCFIKELKKYNETTLRTHLRIWPFGSTGVVQLSFIEFVVMLLAINRLMPSGLPDRVDAVIVGLFVHLIKFNSEVHIHYEMKSVQTGPFTLSVRANAAMSAAISLWLKLLRFLMNQASRSKNGLQAQLITYDAIVDDDTSNQSLMLYVNWPKERSILFTWTIRKILSVY